MSQVAPASGATQYQTCCKAVHDDAAMHFWHSLLLNAAPQPVSAYEQSEYA